MDKMNEAENQLMQHIESEREALVDFTRQLLQIPSVYDEETPGMNEEEVARFVADFLKSLGFEVHVEEVATGRPNVIGILNGDETGKTLLFEGHTDVVTPGDPAKWTHPPFEGVIADDRIYGRGACDTKGNLAAMIYAAKAIQETGQEFSGKILLCIPVDEEGMMTGIKDFIQKGWADDVDAAVICEPQDNQICIEQKGAIRVRANVKGKMAHGAMPFSGINPNWAVGEFIGEVYACQQKEIEHHGAHPYLGDPSITPTIIQAPSEGEAQVNVIPQAAMLTLDIRTVPGQDHEKIKQALSEIANRLETKHDVTFALDFFEDRPCTKTSSEEPIVKAMDQAYQEVTQTTPRYNGVPGATDGTFLHVKKEIPIVTTGAGDRSVPHQVDEYVSIPQLVETTKLYAVTAMQYLKR